MDKQKKPYTPPRVEIHHMSSPAYIRFMALLDKESEQKPMIWHFKEDDKITPDARD